MGHDMAKPATTFMKSRRSIAAPTFRSTPILADYIRDLRPAKWGSGLSLRSSNPEPLMSALCQKQTSARCGSCLLAPVHDERGDFAQIGKDYVGGAYDSPKVAAPAAANRPKTNVPKPSTMSTRIGNARPNIASDGRLTAGKVISNAAAPAPPRPNCCRIWTIGTSAAVGITKSVPAAASAGASQNECPIAGVISGKNHARIMPTAKTSTAHGTSWTARRRKPSPQARRSGPLVLTGRIAAPG